MATQNYSGPAPVGYVRPPFGLMVLAVLVILVGIYILILGVFFWTITAMPSPLFGGVPSMSNFTATLLGLVFILAGASSFYLGYGLYKGRDWARLAALAYGLLIVIIGLVFMGMSIAIPNLGFLSIPFILSGIIIAAYLNLSHVVNYFNYVKQVKARGGTLSYPAGAYPPLPPSGPAPSPPAPVRGSPVQGQPPAPAASGGETTPITPSGPSAPPISSQETMVGGAAGGPSYSLVLPGGKVIRIVNETVKVFGREDFISYLPHNQLSVISRKSKGGHFKITVSYDPNLGKYRYFIEDLNSLNGTYVNGVNIKGQGSVELNHGDVISLGNVVNLEFKTL